MSIYVIDHVQLAMPAGQEDASRAFYGELLGFTEIPKPPELTKRGGVWFERGSVVVHMGVEADFRPARKAHPAFLVDGLDELLTRVADAGLEVDTSQPLLEGYRRALLFDLFGNRIEEKEKL